jgi:hypothetical protein
LEVVEDTRIGDPDLSTFPAALELISSATHDPMNPSERVTTRLIAALP